MGHGAHDDEPLDDGHDDDAESRGAPPDPLDRVWVHPTELPPLAPRFAGASTTSQPTAIRRSRAWLLPAVGGAAGALVTVAVLAISGTLDRGAASGEHNPILPGTRITSAAPAGALSTGLSIVAIAARDANGTRRGSGVCVRHGGGVLTSARLVGSATTVDVLTRDGQKHTARVAGKDRTTDLVLLTLDDAADVPAARLADTLPPTGSAVWVLAAARPGTPDLWLSSGLLSSADAVVAVPGGPMTSGVLETDASTGGGGAGGALIDHDGQVVGIVLTRVGSTDTTYAVPIETAVAIAAELDEKGVAKHGAAGVVLADDATGPAIEKMTTDGPAAHAGVRVGDVVMSVDGRPVESTSDVMAIVHGTEPGRTVTFELRRGRDELKVPVQLASATG